MTGSPQLPRAVDRPSPSCWRIAAAAAGVALAVLAVVSTFGGEMDVPLAAFVVAAFFLIGSVLILRDGRGSLLGLLTVGMLLLVELVFVPFYERPTLADWLIQGAVVAFSLRCGRGVRRAAIDQLRMVGRWSTWHE